MLKKVFFLTMKTIVFQSGYWKIDYVYVILHYLNSNFELSIRRDHLTIKPSRTILALSTVKRKLCLKPDLKEFRVETSCGI